MYETKIALVIKNGLQPWQKLNVAAFLASAVAIRFPDTHGKEFINASGSVYLPFIRQPILIYGAETDADIRRAFNRAKERGLHIGLYTGPLFSTKNEAQNHLEIAKATDENHVLVGLAIYGENKKVAKALDGLRFHQ